MEIEAKTGGRLRRKVLAGSLLSTVFVVLMAGAAFAGTYTGVPSTDGPQAQSDILSFLGTLVSTVAPVLIAVALGVVGIFILGWGIRMVFHKVQSSAHF